MVGGTALNRQGDDLSGLGVRLVPAAGLDLLDLHGGLVGDGGLQLTEQVILRLLGGEAGDALQLLQLLVLVLVRLLLGLLQVGDLLGELLVLALDVFGLAV